LEITQFVIDADRIFVTLLQQEHQKQSELYVNIKSEYEVQLQHKASTRKSSDSDRNQEQPPPPLQEDDQD